MLVQSGLVGYDEVRTLFQAPGENLTSLKKSKGSGWNVRPIAVGEILRRLMGKCACVLTREKTTQFFNPFQYGVACSAGTEKVVHKLRQVIEDNWNNGDFVMLKKLICTMH